MEKGQESGGEVENGYLRVEIVGRRWSTGKSLVRIRAQIDQEVGRRLTLYFGVVLRKEETIHDSRPD